MLQRRTQDPTLRPSVTADPATVRVTFEYLACATLWLLVGTAAGLLDALKLNWPDVLAGSWLSFGRVRPIHTNTVFWGWSSMARRHSGPDRPASRTDRSSLTAKTTGLS